MRRSSQLADFIRNEPRVSLKPCLSSLPLQMLVQYNALLSIMYAVLIGFVSAEKITKYDYYTEVVIYAIWVVMEPIRIYYGYSGNLKESVPRLSTFLLITVFPQLPLVCFLAYFQPSFFPTDRIMGSLMFIFLLVECVFGSLTVRTIIRSQTAQFMRLIEEE